MLCLGVLVKKFFKKIILYLKKYVLYFKTIEYINHHIISYLINKNIS
jgi:hypothetical protein